MRSWRKTICPPTGLVPDDPTTNEYFERLRVNERLHGDLRKMRNAGFHRKFFAMLNLAFEYWEPGEIDCKYGVPEKSFDTFRRDAIILAGYYIPKVRIDGSVRYEAESISWGSMDQEKFEKLY